MPWLVLGAIVATLLLEPSGGSGRLAAWQLRTRLLEASFGPIFVAIVALGVNRFVRRELARVDDGGRAARSALPRGTRFVERLGLVV